MRPNIVNDGSALVRNGIPNSRDVRSLRLGAKFQKRIGAIFHSDFLSRQY